MTIKVYFGHAYIRYNDVTLIKEDGEYIIFKCKDGQHNFKKIEVKSVEIIEL